MKNFLILKKCKIKATNDEKWKFVEKMKFQLENGRWSWKMAEFVGKWRNNLERWIHFLFHENFYFIRKNATKNDQKSFVKWRQKLENGSWKIIRKRWMESENHWKMVDGVGKLRKKRLKCVFLKYQNQTK